MGFFTAPDIRVDSRLYHECEMIRDDVSTISYHIKKYIDYLYGSDSTYDNYYNSLNCSVSIRSNGSNVQAGDVVDDSKIISYIPTAGAYYMGADHPQIIGAKNRCHLIFRKGLEYNDLVKIHELFHALTDSRKSFSFKDLLKHFRQFKGLNKAIRFKLNGIRIELYILEEGKRVGLKFIGDAFNEGFTELSRINFCRHNSKTYPKPKELEIYSSLVNAAAMLDEATEGAAMETYHKPYKGKIFDLIEDFDAIMGMGEWGNLCKKLDYAFENSLARAHNPKAQNEYVISQLEYDAYGILICFMANRECEKIRNLSPEQLTEDYIGYHIDRLAKFEGYCIRNDWPLFGDNSQKEYWRDKLAKTWISAREQINVELAKKLAKSKSHKVLEDVFQELEKRTEEKYHDKTASTPYGLVPESMPSEQKTVKNYGPISAILGALDKSKPGWLKSVHKSMKNIHYMHTAPNSSKAFILVDSSTLERRGRKSIKDIE